MKNIFILITVSIFSSGVWANCSTTKTSPEIQKCLNNEVRSLRLQLDKVYQNTQQQTQAKLELQKSQDLWVKYKEMQCGDFIVADSQGSPTAIEYDLTCQSILYKQRIDLLKSIFN